MRQMNLAILSPSQNGYSETFIQAHKSLPFKTSYYFGDYIPSQLENSGPLIRNSWERNLFRLRRRIYEHMSVPELALVSSLKANKIDVVLAEYGTTAACCLEAIKMLKLPLIVHFHGYDASVENILNAYREKYKEIFIYAKAVIVVSKKMYSQLLTLGCPKEKLYLNTCGPNPTFFKVCPSFKTKQFVSVGRFVDKKAPFLTIVAFKEVVNQYPDARLVMIGDGPLYNTCENLIKALDLKDNIELRGILNVTEIMKVFESSIGFVQHSVRAQNGDSEGTPVAILEASAASLPVISTNHAGIPEVVMHSESGYLVEEFDVVSMSEYIKQVYQNPDHGRKLGECGASIVKSNFTLEKHLKMLSDIIKASLVTKSVIKN